MSKAEKFILESTNQFSNEDGFDYIPWLTPDQARKAVEIAREEMIEKAVKWIENNFSLYEGISGYYVAKDLKQAMKDE